MAFNIQINFEKFASNSQLFNSSTPDGIAAQETVKRAAAEWAKYIKDDFDEIPGEHSNLHYIPHLMSCSPIL
jgi:hypothetical protein